MKTRPHTLTDFRRLGKRRLTPQTAEGAKAIHDGRQPEWTDPRPVPCITQFGRWSTKRYGRLPAHACMIPLGEHTVPTSEYKRAKNWVAAGAGVYSRVDKIDCGKYSSGCTYTKYEYQQTVESWGFVANGTLVCWIDKGSGVHKYTLRPCRGWHWVIDTFGIALVDGKGQRDYHPTASDILAAPRTSVIAAMAREYEKTRRENAKRARHERGVIRQAHKTGLLVCLRDSVSAGNCRAGSTTWARQHKLDPTRHYTPTRLLAMANGDRHRVALVVQVAARRHVKEMAAGICQLSDHR